MSVGVCVYERDRQTDRQGERETLTILSSHGTNQIIPFRRKIGAEKLFRNSPAVHVFKWPYVSPSNNLGVIILRCSRTGATAKICKVPCTVTLCLDGLETCPRYLWSQM